MEQEEKMEAARKRAREEKEEREEKAKKDLNVRKSLVSKKYELDLDRASVRVLSLFCLFQDPNIF